MTGTIPTVEIKVPPAKYSVPATNVFLPIPEVAAYNAAAPALFNIFTGNDEVEELSIDVMSIFFSLVVGIVNSVLFV